MSMNAKFRAVSPGVGAGLLSRDESVLDAVLEDSGSPTPAEGLGRVLDVHKDWHALNYLLTGGAGPDETLLGSAVLGGAEISDDLGYGPARYLGPADVADIAASMADAQPLIDRYDADSMDSLELYPGGWEDEDNEDSVRESAAAMVTFYSEAAAAGWGVVLWLD